MSGSDVVGPVGQFEGKPLLRMEFERLADVETGEFPGVENDDGEDAAFVQSYCACM